MQMTLKYLFPEREWQIFVFHHVQYLPSHSKREQYNPIEKEDRPKHRHIKHTEESHHHSNAECLCN